MHDVDLAGAVQDLLVDLRHVLEQHLAREEAGRVLGGSTVRLPLTSPIEPTSTECFFETHGMREAPIGTGCTPALDIPCSFPVRPRRGPPRPLPGTPFGVGGRVR